MRIEPLGIEGAFVVTPRQFPDGRGVFLESFRGDRLAEHLGHRPDVVQTNVSVSSRGTVRGIHYADVPPSQAKYVTAAAGSLLDVVVDIRVGSPTFGRWEAVLLDATDRRAVYLSEGLGHAFCALEDGTTAVYLCTAAYNPTGEHGIHPLDPDVGIRWPEGVTPLLSPKDAAAPGLREAAEAGSLPTYAACRAWAEELASRS
jgi:dTDP-4-dehydrorhamnose 3,5-epimerase